jgi:hypothetical protein
LPRKFSASELATLIDVSFDRPSGAPISTIVYSPTIEITFVRSMFIHVSFT